MKYMLCLWQCQLLLHLSFILVQSNFWHVENIFSSELMTKSLFGREVSALLWQQEREECGRRERVVSVWSSVALKFIQNSVQSVNTWMQLLLQSQQGQGEEQQLLRDYISFYRLIWKHCQVVAHKVKRFR